MQCHRPRDVFDGKLSGGLSFASAGLPNVGALKHNGGITSAIEEIGTVELAIHRRMAGRETFCIDGDLDRPRLGRSSRKNDPALNGFKTTGHGQEAPAALKADARILCLNGELRAGMDDGRYAQQREAETDHIEHAAHKLRSTFACPIDFAVNETRHWSQWERTPLGLTQALEIGACGETIVLEFLAPLPTPQRFMGVRTKEAVNLRGIAPLFEKPLQFADLVPGELSLEVGLAGTGISAVGAAAKTRQS
jgi:hypothetical protein